MKFQPTRLSPWLQLFSLFLLLTSTFSCTVQELELNDFPPQPAAVELPGEDSGGGGGDEGDCYCGSCTQFDLQHRKLREIPSNIPLWHQYDFAFKVTAQNTCDLSTLNPTQCSLKRRDFILSFNGIFYDQFLNIDLFDFQGAPVNYTLGFNGGSIVATEEFTACFKLKPAYQNLVLNNNHFTSGGICIIGIITDPGDTGGGGASDGDGNG